MKKHTNFLTGKFESKSKDSDDLLTTEKKYLETTIVSLLKDSIENKTINLVSSLSARLVFLNSLPLSYRDSNKNKIRRLLFRINQKRLSKYDSIKKISWDEQEYIFLIAIGSIICSVFYIAVLIKRYPIVISIEKLIAEINKAKIWNNREESMHFKKTELELELERMIRDGKNTPVEIIKTYDNKIDDYADRLQKQLATCEFIASNIETNIKIVSMFRSIGLGMFFTVVLISTLMIDSFLSIILLIIITYAIFIAEILNEQSIVIRFWRLLFKKHETNNIIFK